MKTLHFFLLSIIAIVLALPSCDDSSLDDEILEDSIRRQDLNALLLDNGWNYGQFKKYLDAQKIFFIDNNSDNTIYEITLDYKDAFVKDVLTLSNVYLKAEVFAQVDFDGHIAATIDGEYLVVAEDGGSQMVSIKIDNKEITPITKPELNLTQIGFDMNGDLYAAGGSDFYKVEGWETGNSTFINLEYDGVSEVSGGDLIFLNYPARPNSFISFSQQTETNDGDGAYLIDNLGSGENGSTLTSYLKIFEVAPKVTGACVVGENTLVTVHEELEKAIFYTASGKEVVRLPIQTKDGKLFVLGEGDLASVNLYDGNFFEEHINEGTIHVASNEEGKFYSLDLMTGKLNPTKDFGHRVDIHFGILDGLVYYSYKYDGARQLRKWDIDSDEDVLLTDRISAEKVEIHGDSIYLMAKGTLTIIDRFSGEKLSSTKYDSIGSGGDLLVSSDEKHLIVFDRRNSQIHTIQIDGLELISTISSPVPQVNGAAYNRDGTIIVSALGNLYVLNDEYQIIGRKLLGFVQNNGDLASIY
ncbi:MAG: hypothetical protein JXR10_04415 [Cyclobacteriaceae bacterium]